MIACDMNKSRPWFRDRIPAIKEAAKSSKYNIELVDIYGILGEKKFNPTNKEERKLFLQNCDLIRANKNFENYITESRPKVLVLGTADNYRQFLQPQTVKNIRACGIYVAGILGDDEFNYQINRFLLGWFDLFIAYVRSCVDYYEKFDLAKGYFFPNSCYLNKKKFDDHHQDTENDAVLVGAPIWNRPAMVKALIEADVNLVIYGSEEWAEYDFAKDYYCGFIPTEKFDEAISKSKIVLAFLEDHVDGTLHMNTKIWEAVRVGRLPIVTKYEPLFYDYGLKEGEDIITYSDTVDLVKKVKFYSSSHSERLRVARNLYSKIEDNFDYSFMYGELFDRLISLQSSQQVSVCVNSGIYSFLNDKAVKYFASKTSDLDSDVGNWLGIVNKIDPKKVDYVYFDKLEKGKRVSNKWPFISLDSIIFLHKQKSTLFYLLTFVKAFFFGRTIHVRQFGVVSRKTSAVGNVNRLISKVGDKKIGLGMKKYLKKLARPEYYLTL